MPLSFEIESNALANGSFRSAFSPSIGVVVATGHAGACHQVVGSGDNGYTWIDGGCPLGSGANGSGVAWSAALGIFVVTATTSGTPKVATSPDGFAWTGHTVTMSQLVSGIAWSDHQAKFVATGCVDGSGNSIWTSPDGLTWTGRGTPTDFGCGKDVDYSPTLDLWVAGDDCGQLYSSPDGITWTLRANPLDDGACDGDVFGVHWLPIAGMFYALGTDDLATGTVAVARSSNGTTWAAVTTPFQGGIGLAVDINEVAGVLYLTGQKGATRFAQSSDGGSTWAVEPTPQLGPGTSITVTPASVVLTSSVYPSIMTASLLPPPPRRAARFFEGYPWRFIFADIPTATATGGRTTTWASNAQTSRVIVKNLDQPTVVTLDVRSDDPQVNTIDPDGYPLVAQSKRLVYCFRREGGATPWVIRAAGIVMIVEDEGDPDSSLTHLTAYDPWQLLQARPCVNASGVLPGPLGFQTWGTFGLRGDQVITGTLAASIASAIGGHAFIDAGVAHGGTPYYAGTIEATSQVLLQVQQGQSVADVWNQVCDAGFCDIVLTPIYDPLRRPGYTHELNVYNLAGVQRPSAVFSWDRMNRSASGISRLHDATPGNFADVVQYYVGQGGPPAPLQINAAAVADFGYYWSTQFFPEQTIPSGAVVTSLAQQALYLARQGQRTVTLTLTPERAPEPLIDYDVADFVPVWATNRLRAPLTTSFAPGDVNAFRVQTLPISISDDGIESVNGLIVSPDWRTSPTGLDPVVTAPLVSQGVDQALARGLYGRRARVVYRLRKPLT